MMVKTVLLNGRERTPMLSYRQMGLSEKEIDDGVAYVRSFENQKTNEPPPT